MELEQLRHGNYVSYYEEQHIGYILAFKTRAFGGDSEVVVTVEGGGYTVAFVDGLKPVPLNYEWLIKLGFQGRKDFVWKGIVGVQIKDGKFYLALKDLSNVLFHSVVEIEHVHTLQNLVLDLTGKK